MEEADPKSIGGAPKTGNYVAKSFDSKSTAGAPKTGNSVAKSSGSKTTAGAPKTGNSAPKSSESKLSKSKSLKPKVPPQAKKSSAQPKKNAPSANALAREEPPKDPYRFIFGTTLSSSEESDEGDPELFAEPRPKKIKEKKRQSSSLKTLPGGVPLAPGAVNPQQHFELLQAQQGYAVQQTPQNRIPIPSAAQLLQQQGYEHASQNRVPKSHPAQLANQQGYAVQNAPQHPLFTPQPAQPPHQQGHAVQHAPQIPVAVQQPAQPANQHQVNFETLRQAAAGARYPPHIWNPNRMAQFGNAFLFHQERLKSLAQQQDLSPEDEENLRLYKAAADTMMNFARNHKRPAEDENEQAAIPEPAPASAPAAPAAKTELDHDDLAISKIRRATKDKPCTFCKFKCDFGVSNDDALMSKDVSSGYCEECDLANSQSEFYQLWMSEPRYKKAIGRRGTKDQRVVGNENDDTAAGLEAGAGDEKVFSKIDGADITKYMKPMFCQYWHQVDVHKVRICDDCRVEKLLVIGHANHFKFLPIHVLLADDSYEPKSPKVPNAAEKNTAVANAALTNADLAAALSSLPHERAAMTGSSAQALAGHLADAFPEKGSARVNIFKDAAWKAGYAADRRCMICTNHAISICESCPLKVCATCEVVIGVKKGRLDMLVYHFERTHVRNDAFLLRSDGGGY